MKSPQKQHIHHIIFICLLMVVGWGQCIEGEVDLGWGDCNELWSEHTVGCMSSGCYSIEQTTELNYSYITLGQISSNIGELTNLNYIHLSDCGISGEIPLEIGNLENLILLQIYDNNHDLLDSLGVNSNLSGEIPSEIGYLINLEYLNLKNNELTGTIPTELGDLDDLKSLIINGNELTGQIPIEIGNLEELQTIDFSNNQFVGEIPESLFSLMNLTFLSLGINQLNGDIPTGINDLSLLYYLDLSSNNLTGQIPSEMEDIELVYLKLNNNQLSGSIPTQFCNIYSVDLSENQFCPTYPDCVTEEELGYQNISECEELPSICDEGTEVELWGVCYNIEETFYLNLYSNGLTGEISSDIGYLINLEGLYLSSNQLTGGIPSEIGNLINLEELYLSYNDLDGEIPIEISNLVNLEELYLSSNFLRGLIPESICDIYPQLTNFLITHNNLCPPYPPCLTESSIGYQDTTNCPPLSISELIIPIQYTLNQPFPNPFNPTTSISFSIPEQSQTSLKVYDIKGNLISTLLNQTMNVGHHQIEWNGENLSSGTYFIRINSGEFSDVKKVVLVK
jgi:Leucine-rich repeat (LRR) protein